ncbi:patatin-like phospholipase family protein [Chelatococcus sp. SYSU_G07232]|uniref:Patatin-like phospholipase family protein n=1 Tax=Chelatococcus albus TaxID=3047466 RepID=A0ABT7AET3_9HYPH|nr:patatin-like phospholipase family protein [Chelatococcus sp. SYSU_G07232]MDJ1157872.1 patatin-like phospholipase family protein [Chelatococcus sp. SYSU_G07232]
MRAISSPSPTVAVALGGGGARGLAHVAVLEAFDELGVKPVALAGTSMGAIIGAAYAAGLTGREIHGHVADMLRDRAQVLARLLQARVGRLSHLLSGVLSNPVLIDSEKFLDLFWPAAVPDRFEELLLPLAVVATDYYARREVLFDEGPLVSAVAASMAIPGLVRPVEIGGRVLVDGGAVNPLPFEHLIGRADVIVAVDVTGGPMPVGAKGRRSARRERTAVDAPRATHPALPDPFETMFGASLIMQNAIVAEKLKARAPDVLVRPAVEGFRGLDFFKARAIFAAAVPAKDEVKRALERLLSRPVSAARERNP